VGFFVAYYYIVLYGQDVIGLDNNASIDLLVAMSTANLIGRVLPALLSDACKSSHSVVL
jgi:predicted MFS family arabinose efflux permease